jgi:hypothetical protein
VRRHSKAIVATFALMMLTCAFGVTSAIAAPPVVTIGPVSEVSYTSAHVSGTIDADESFTFFRFEYSTDPAGEGWISSPFDGPVAFGVGPVEVSANLSGLKPGTEYQVRLVAERSGIPTVSAEPNATFTTVVSAPGVVTGTPNDITGFGATLHGTISPHGLQTTYYFEYGTDSEYDTRVPLDHDLVAGGGAGVTYAEQPIADLQPETEYHFRLTAVSSAGTSHGADEVFTTEAPLARTRGFEMVSPPDKGGGNVDPTFSHAAPDGNSLVYPSKTALGGSVESDAAPLTPKYYSARTDSDWLPAKAIDPAQIPGQTSIRFYTALGVSEDNSTAFVVSLKSLAPGSTDGDSNVYLRDTATGAFTTIATSPGPHFDRDSHYPAANTFVGGTEDFSHVVFNGLNTTLVPGAAPYSLYDWTDGELRLVGIRPNGTPFAESSFVGNGEERDPHYISDDGSKIFFNSEGSTWVRKDGTSTELLGAGYFVGASRDGHVVYYSDGALHRRNFDTGESEVVIPGLESSNVLQVSGNGEYVYFMKGLGIYVWHEGEVLHIATLDEAQDYRPKEWMASPNGRYFSFGSYSKLTGYDNASTACHNVPLGDRGTACREAYRYDVQAEQLLCASCRADGRVTTGNANMGNIISAEFSHHWARSMLDTGELIFDTPDQLSAHDINSRRDVYSFDGKQATLISTGRGDGDSQFADAGTDGRDIFFTTDERLVGQDTDSLVDVYDARTGGGLASQEREPPRGECIRDDCKATPGAGPELPFGGSEGLNGPENVRPPARKHCGKGRQVRKVKGKSRCVKHPKPHTKRRQGR